MIYVYDHVVKQRNIYMYGFTGILFQENHLNQANMLIHMCFFGNDIEMNMLNYSHQTIKSDLICSWHMGCLNSIWGSFYCFYRL